MTEDDKVEAILDLMSEHGTENYQSGVRGHGGESPYFDYALREKIVEILRGENFPETP